MNSILKNLAATQSATELGLAFLGTVLDASAFAQPLLASGAAVANNEGLPSEDFPHGSSEVDANHLEHPTVTPKSTLSSNIK